MMRRFALPALTVATLVLAGLRVWSGVAETVLVIGGLLCLLGSAGLALWRVSGPAPGQLAPTQTNLPTGASLRPGAPPGVHHHPAPHAGGFGGHGGFGGGGGHGGH